MYINNEVTPIAEFDPGKPTKAKPKKSWIFKAWRPRPSFLALMLFIGSFGILFLVLGIIIVIYSQSIFEYEVRYDDKCELDDYCIITTFNVTKRISPPIYIQYRITDFYQNHLKYTRSIPLAQMREQTLFNPTDLEDCKPFLTNQEMSKTISVLNNTLIATDPAIPCGLAAYTFFNDTFDLVSISSNLDVDISDKGIAWSSDKEHKFKNIDLSKQWINLEDERFINWMKIAPFPNFIKTWGVINNDLLPGTYELRVNNTWNNIIFGGEKYFILREALFFGGSNYFLGSVFIVVGSLSILTVIFFTTRKLTYRQKFHEA